MRTDETPSEQPTGRADREPGEAPRYQARPPRPAQVRWRPEAEGGLLHWCVPLRRAVVKQRVTYDQLFAEWMSKLYAHQEVLERWYPELDFGRAMVALMNWRACYFRLEQQELHTAWLTTQNQLACIPTGDCLVRLWKGPLRVILEQRVGEGNPIEYHGETLSLDVQEGVVHNADAAFLMGDLVELPLFEVLERGGLEAYQGLRFNPQGSPFLGTTVVGPNGQGGDDLPRLPENMTAMRFQLLLSLARGAFYTDQPVFTSEQDQMRGPSARTSEDDLVWARGMIFGGNWGRPSRDIGPSFPAWMAATNGWGTPGRGTTVIQNAATRAGRDRLSGVMPVTPGWACSPVTIFLSHFLFNETDNGTYGENSVGAAMTTARQQRSPLRGHFDEITAAQLMQAVGADGTEGLEQHLQYLRDRIETLLPRLNGQASIAAHAMRTAMARPEWEQLDRVSRNTLERRRESAHSLHEFLAPRVQTLTRRGERRTEEQELQLTLFGDLRRDLLERAAAVREEIEELYTSESWDQVPTDPMRLFFEGLPSNATLAEDIAQPDANQLLRIDHDRHGQALFKRLTDKQTSLQAIQPNPDSLMGGYPAGTVDLSQPSDSRDWTLTDLNIVSLDGHEWVIIKMLPADRLLQRESLPRRGFLTAYDPLSGAECVVGEGERERGQMYIFEAYGQLLRWGSHSVYGCNPSKWVRLAGNQLRVVRLSSDNVRLEQLNVFPDGEVTPDGVRKPMMKFWTLKDPDGAKTAHDTLAPPASEQDGVPGWLPIFIRPQVGDNSTALERYATRAVPFPSMRDAEESGRFLSWTAMEEAAASLKAAATAAEKTAFAATL